jgi:hypothetical protein
MTNVTSVNSTMKEINDLTDDLYESLIDNDITATKKIVKDLYKVLNYIKSTIQEDVTPCQ